MKPNQLILSIVFFLFTFFSYSQNYPFPTSNSIWTNIGSSYTLDEWNMPIWQTNWIDRYCSNGSDTVINTITYRKIDLCTVSNSFYHGALRYNVGAVYFVPKDSLNEYLLYDFSVSVGDTVNVIQNICDGWSSACANTPNYSIMSIPINDIDTIIVNGTQRRRINQSAGINQWIEGIGSTAGLFLYLEENVSNYSYGLRCASENDTTVYDYLPLVSGLPGHCDLSLSIDQVIDSPSFTIYPNPVNGGTILIEGGENDDIDINIFNSNGIEVLNIPYLNSNTVDVTHLTPGVYVVRIISDRSYSIQKLLITN